MLERIQADSKETREMLNGSLKLLREAVKRLVGGADENHIKFHAFPAPTHFRFN